MKLFLKAIVSNPDLAALTSGKEGGIGPLDVCVWRSGTLVDGSRGIFFSGDQDGAQAYSDLHNMQPVQYRIQAQNVYVTRNHFTLCKALLGKSFQDEVMRVDLATGGKSSILAARKVEAKMAKALLKLKYDALVYTNPPAPAKTELAVLNIKSVKIQPI